MHVVGDKVTSINTIDMPYTASTRHLACDELILWCAENTFLTFPDKTYILIEQGSARPSEGVASAFSFGRQFGSMETVGYALKVLAENNGVAFEKFVIVPKEWQRHLVPHIESNIDKKERKNQHYLKLLELYPDLKDKMLGVKGGLKDGRVDSVMIAEFGRRLFSGELTAHIGNHLNMQIVGKDIEKAHEIKQLIDEVRTSAKNVTARFRSDKRKKRTYLCRDLVRIRKELKTMLEKVKKYEKKWVEYYKVS